MSDDINTEDVVQIDTAPVVGQSAADSFITIRFSTAPGALSSLVLNAGSNVNDAIAAAGVDTSRVKTILVNNIVRESTNPLIDQDTVVVALHGAKGN